MNTTTDQNVTDQQAADQQTMDQGERLLPYKFMQPEAVQAEDGNGVKVYRDIEFALIRGFRPLVMDLTIPKTQQERVPVVVYIHPGGWLTGSHKDTHTYAAMGAIWESLLGAGLAVASIQYRLSSEAQFPACLQDAASAVRWLRRFAGPLGLDPDRIGTWGESSGGHLSTFLAMNLNEESLLGSAGVSGVSSAVQAAVSWYPPTDFLSMHAQGMPGVKADHEAPDSPESRLIGAALRSAPDRARQASSLAWVNAAAAPLLFVHGENDQLVPVQQSQTVYEALKAAGAETEIRRVPAADHQLKGVDSAPFISLSTEFLRQRLAR